MPKVIKINGAYKLPDKINSQKNSAKFDYIFEAGVWRSNANIESHSGSGSTLENTKLYLDQLKQYLDLFKSMHNVTEINFFDAPCGDLNWVKEIFGDLNYQGGDISKKLIANVKEKYPDIKIFFFDIIEDEFPKADIWHCRHCLFHLSLKDIVKSFQNFCMSNINEALITNHFMPDSITFDIDTGSFRFLDLTNFPFYLPKPKIWLLDRDPLDGKMAMATGVWNRKQIAVGIENYKKLMKP